ncbi:DUF1540 domain-containing protein [Eubacteriales bacterium OttesenSCG-928-K08]|nr:DUF1540 domain-containing protein [Eubacteriales bacterium OttesenSCG-928-K08]
METKLGKQSIGCEVSSCAYHCNNACELDRITVRACQNCTSGHADSETLCGSYQTK